MTTLPHSHAVLAAELAAQVGQSPTEMRQSFWKARIDRLEAEQRAGGSGVAIARAIADAVDTIVLDAHGEASSKEGGGSYALVALGGYGRQEMAPYSDVDLLFVFAKDRDKKPSLIAGVLHPLWDLGFDLGHSSRTISESLEMAKEDLESCTAMMDARFLAGDRDLCDKFQTRLLKGIPKGTVSRLEKLRQGRPAGSGSVQLLEPNVKTSPGALREIHLLEWAVKAQAAREGIEPRISDFLAEDEAHALRDGREFLWRVRHELHLTTQRKHDQLEHEIKQEIASRLGYADRPVNTRQIDSDASISASGAVEQLKAPGNRVGPADRVGADRGLEFAVEQFMQQYYLHARGIYHYVELGFRHLTKKTRRRGRRILLEPGVVALDGELLLPDGEGYFREDPIRLLRVFSLARNKRLQFSEAAQRTVRQSIHLIDDAVRRSPVARDIFMELLPRRRRVVETLRMMHDLGVLGAYLPEFGTLTCLVQFDIYHVCTVDEHTLVAVDNVTALAGNQQESSMLNRVYASLKRRDLLVLGILLHDVGKSRREEHVRCGMEMTEDVVARLGLPEADRMFLLFLVEHHQDMVITSQRRDLNDYKMIADFAALFANEEWLNALYLLSYADLRAVAEDAWSDWHGALLLELYHKTREQLQSGIKTLEDRQRARQIRDGHLRSVEGLWPPPKVMAFEKHIDQLPAEYLMAYERDQIERHVNLMEKAISTTVAATDFVEHADHTELMVCSSDQHHLLAKICGVLAVNDIDILRAGVNTRDDGMVLDIFQVTEVDGSATLPQRKRQRVVSQLEVVVGGERLVTDLFDNYSAHWNRRRRREAPIRETAFEFENQVSDRYTVIDIEVSDEVGLLYKITRILGEMDLDIHRAIINTVAGRARDAFYISDQQGRKIVNYDTLEAIRDRLTAEFEPTRPSTT